MKNFQLFFFAVLVGFYSSAVFSERVVTEISLGDIKEQPSKKQRTANSFSGYSFVPVKYDIESKYLDTYIKRNLIHDRNYYLKIDGLLLVRWSLGTMLGDPIITCNSAWVYKNMYINSPGSVSWEDIVNKVPLGTVGEISIPKGYFESVDIYEIQLAIKFATEGNNLLSINMMCDVGIPKDSEILPDYYFKDPMYWATHVSDENVLTEVLGDKNNKHYSLNIPMFPEFDKLFKSYSMLFMPKSHERDDAWSWSKEDYLSGKKVKTIFGKEIVVEQSFKDFFSNGDPNMGFSKGESLVISTYEITPKFISDSTIFSSGEIINLEVFDADLWKNISNDIGQYLKNNNIVSKAYSGSNFGAKKENEYVAERKNKKLKAMLSSSIAGDFKNEFEEYLDKNPAMDYNVFYAERLHESGDVTRANEYLENFMYSASANQLLENKAKSLAMSVNEEIKVREQKEEENRIRKEQEKAIEKARVERDEAKDQIVRLSKKLANLLTMSKTLKAEEYDRQYDYHDKVSIRQSVKSNKYGDIWDVCTLKIDESITTRIGTERGHYKDKENSSYNLELYNINTTAAGKSDRYCHEEGCFDTSTFSYIMINDQSYLINSQNVDRFFKSIVELFTQCESYILKYQSPSDKIRLYFSQITNLMHEHNHMVWFKDLKSFIDNLYLVVNDQQNCTMQLNQKVAWGKEGMHRRDLDYNEYSFEPVKLSTHNALRSIFSNLYKQSGERYEVDGHLKVIYENMRIPFADKTFGEYFVDRLGKLSMMCDKHIHKIDYYEHVCDERAYKHQEVCSTE